MPLAARTAPASARARGRSKADPGARGVCEMADGMTPSGDCKHGLIHGPSKVDLRSMDGPSQGATPRELMTKIQVSSGVCGAWEESRHGR